MYQQITIKTLWQQGKTVGEIAKDMNCHRNTVRNIIKREPNGKQARDRFSSFDTYQERVKEMLNKNLSRIRIWQILKDEYETIPTYDALGCTPYTKNLFQNSLFCMFSLI